MESRLSSERYPDLFQGFYSLLKKNIEDKVAEQFEELQKENDTLKKDNANLRSIIISLRKPIVQTAAAGESSSLEKMNPTGRGTHIKNLSSSHRKLFHMR